VTDPNGRYYLVKNYHDEYPPAVTGGVVCFAVVGCCVVAGGVVCFCVVTGGVVCFGVVVCVVDTAGVVDFNIIGSKSSE
jgi:hypothetical protein